MKRGKRYIEAAKTVDRTTLYDVTEAISLVKKNAVAKFDETIAVSYTHLVNKYKMYHIENL